MSRTISYRTTYRATNFFLTIFSANKQQISNSANFIPLIYKMEKNERHLCTN